MASATASEVDFGSSDSRRVVSACASEVGFGSLRVVSASLEEVGLCFAMSRGDTSTN